LLDGVVKLDVEGELTPDFEVLVNSLKMKIQQILTANEEIRTASDQLLGLASTSKERDIQKRIE
jgi:hypothetical protein